MGTSQEIPLEFFEARFESIMHDFGMNWENNSTLGSVRFQTSSNYEKIEDKKNDSLNINLRFGGDFNKSYNALYFFSHFTFKKYLYGYLYPRIVNNPNMVPRYSGVPRDISRFGFSSGETDLSGIGYQNDWLLFQIGRGRESWGSIDGMNLALNQNSSPYDYFLLGSDYGKLRVKYIHGFLESNNEQVNRYITARGVEWSNENSLVIGLSESVIYSGEDRPIDFSYMNPISSHLEVELNDKLNNIGDIHANAVWQISLDYLFKNKIRVSGNILYDEFVLDDEQLAKGKEHGKAYSLRLSFVNRKFKDNLINTYISFIRVGTPTFRHGNGNNNFIQRNNPIGWPQGSDAEQLKIGINYVKINQLFVKLEFKHLLVGEESIVYRPYEPYADYEKGKFPSGSVISKNFIDVNVNWLVKNNISITYSNRFLIEDFRISENEFNFGVNTFYLFNTKI